MKERERERESERGGFQDDNVLEYLNEDGLSIEPRSGHSGAHKKIKKQGAKKKKLRRIITKQIGQSII